METIPEESEEEEKEEEEKEEGNNNETELTRLSHRSAVGHSPEEPKETEADSAELHDCSYLQIRDGSKGKSEFFMIMSSAADTVTERVEGKQTKGHMISFPFKHIFLQR